MKEGNNLERKRLRQTNDGGSPGISKKDTRGGRIQKKKLLSMLPFAVTEAYFLRRGGARVPKKLKKKRKLSRNKEKGIYWWRFSGGLGHEGKGGKGENLQNRGGGVLKLEQANRVR